MKSKNLIFASITLAFFAQLLYVPLCRANGIITMGETIRRISRPLLGETVGSRPTDQIITLIKDEIAIPALVTSLLGSERKSSVAQRDWNSIFIDTSSFMSGDDSSPLQAFNEILQSQWHAGGHFTHREKVIQFFHLIENAHRTIIAIADEIAQSGNSQDFAPTYLAIIQAAALANLWFIKMNPMAQDHPEKQFSPAAVALSTEFLKSITDIPNYTEVRGISIANLVQMEEALHDYVSQARPITLSGTNSARPTDYKEIMTIILFNQWVLISEQLKRLPLAAGVFPASKWNPDKSMTYMAARNVAIMARRFGVLQREADFVIASPKSYLDLQSLFDSVPGLEYPLEIIPNPD